MKHRLVVLVAGLSLGMLAACGGVTQEEPKGTPPVLNPVTNALECPICPVAPGQVESMSRTPVTDAVTGQVYCWPCDGGICGNGYCEFPEDSTNCPYDCGSTTPYCGDGVCNGSESCSTCSGDCGSCGSYCGDGVCNGSESCYTCSDCGSCGPYCGDGSCDYPETRFNCRADCGTWCFDEVCP